MFKCLFGSKNILFYYLRGCIYWIVSADLQRSAYLLET
uniref:Uncharacterized protein n=1 Tax=Anguilla anguilla TaxID=7936 RepID=A0A0E9U4Y1_ANGAN